MHEENFRAIEEEMVVEGCHVETVVERSCHRGIDFVFKQNGVAHHDCAITSLSKRCPSAEAHERRHCPSVQDRKSTRLNSSHTVISYAVFCLKKKNKNPYDTYQHECEID